MDFDKIKQFDFRLGNTAQSTPSVPSSVINDNKKKKDNDIPVNPYIKKFVLNSQTPEPKITNTGVIPVDDIKSNPAQTPNFNIPSTPSKVTTDINTIINGFDSSQPKTSGREDIQSRLLALLDKDDSADKEAIRKDLEIAEKEERARKISNEITARDRAYQKQIEALEKNLDGRGASALQDEINDLNRERNRELADLSIQYNVASGDYLAAEKIMNDRIQDIDDENARELTILQTAYNFVQNDMTDTEKFKAEKAFDIYFENQRVANEKEIASYKSLISAEKQTSPASSGELDGTLSVYDMTTELLSEELRNGLSESVGPHALTRINLNKLVTGGTGGVNKFRSLFKNLLSKEVLDYYAQIKQAGVTFGALSEKELDLINQAATGRFGGIYDDDGNFEGRSNLTEKDFIELLEKTRTSSQKAYILRSRGGSEELGRALRQMSPEKLQILFDEIRDGSLGSGVTQFSDNELTY